mgnify:FL=1
MENTVELLHQIGKLKDLKRTGWVLRKVPNSESVADHSFRVSVMALLLSEKFKLDVNKCVQMALIHDIAEAVIGDITIHDKITNKEKHKFEDRAMKSLFVKNRDILGLWNEYEERKTPEAKFVYQIDKLETLLQAFEYSRKYKKLDLSEFWENFGKKIKDPELTKIVKMLKKE